MVASLTLVVSRLESERETAVAVRGVVRCRLREDGIEVELDETTLDALSERRRHEVHDLVRAAWADRGDRPVSLAPYRRGSAFLRSRAEV